MMSEGDEMKGKVVVMGLGGGRMDLVGPWAQEGNCPILPGLRVRGHMGCSDPYIQPMSAQAWAYMGTELNIGKHGLVDFVMRKLGGMNCSW